LNTATPLRRLKAARYVDGFRVWLSFDDGCQGVADLAAELYGEMFEALRDQRQFAQLRADPTLGTLVWPNGADLAPEFLYEKLRNCQRTA
jgi:hypothetical protein